MFSVNFINSGFVVYVSECCPRIAMSRLVDYFVIVGFDHEKESKYIVL